MISDEDVRNFYNHLDSPGVYGNSPFDLQIFRGKSPFEKNPGGCERNDLIFKKYHVIPEYCFECYKVLVEPRTVMELFKLLMLFNTPFLPKNHRRKCMTEFRKDCSGAYKGFIYCREMEDGKAVFDIVRSAVTDEISPEIPVSLKRGCSHFGAAFPEYASMKPGVEPMKYNENWRVHEEEFDRDAVYTQAGSKDPNVNLSSTFTPSEIFAMTFWLGYAASIGDDSYLKISGCTLPPIPGLKRPQFVGI